MTRPRGALPAAPPRTSPRAPSGARFPLRYAGQAATAVEVGGAIRSYTAAGRPVLGGYGAGERCTGARGQTLIPWPNRLRDGTYTFGGTAHQLPLTEPGKRNAIHGLARWARWSAARHDKDRVTRSCVLYPQPRWPFTLDLSIGYHLGPGGLSVRTTATNTGTAPCPYGTGAHPYLTPSARIIDTLTLRAAGATRPRTDDQGIRWEPSRRRERTMTSGPPGPSARRNSPRATPTWTATRTGSPGSNWLTPLVPSPLRPGAAQDGRAGGDPGLLPDRDPPPRASSARETETTAPAPARGWPGKPGR